MTPTAVYKTAKGTTHNAIGHNAVDNFIYGIISSDRIRCCIVWGKPATGWYERSITGCRAGCLWQLLRQRRVFSMLLGVITLQGRAEATLRLRRPSELALVPSSEPHRFRASRTCCPARLPTAATLTFMARAVPTACCWARPVKLPQPTIVYGRSR